MPTLANIDGRSLSPDPAAYRNLGEGLGSLVGGYYDNKQEQANQQQIGDLTEGALGGDNTALIEMARLGEDGANVAGVIQRINQSGDKAAASKLSAGLKEAGAFAASMIGKPAQVQRQSLLVRAKQMQETNPQRSAELVDMANMAESNQGGLLSEFQQTIAISGLGKDQLSVFGMGGGDSLLDKAKTEKLVSETKLLDQKFKALGSSDTPTEDKVKIEKDLRQEVFNRSKDFEKVDDAWRRVEVSAMEPSAAGDMAMIFNYMKMLDPGSTVREGEFATAQQAGGVDDITLSTYNRILDGTRLSPKQRADFTKRAKSLYGVAKNKQDGISKKYKGLAKRYGVDYENVILSVDKPALSDEDLLNKYGG